jgi:hypothetical protein
MASTIAERIADGALAVFYVPSWKPGRDGVDEAWNRSAWVVEAITGVKLEPLIGRVGLRIAAAPDCPPAIVGLFERAHASYELRLRVDGLGASVDHRVLGAIESPTGIPCAVAGFPGTGAWLILPSDASAHVALECGAAAGLLDVLEGMRPPAPLKRGAGRRRAQARPRAGTKLDEALLALERAPVGAFVGIRDRKAIEKLKAKYKVKIESVADARERRAKVPPDMKGYRLIPGSTL